jgi:hypothetical protein
MFFAVSVMIESVRSDGTQGAVEEQIYLVEADSPKSAEARGRELGLSACADYSVEGGVQVSMRLRAIERTYPIEGELQDGTELFSRFLRPDEADSILTRDL